MLPMKTLLAFATPGPFEMMIIGIIALLLFGKRLPEVARSLGKGIVEFKKGVKGIEDDVDHSSYHSSSNQSASSRPVPQDDQDQFTAPRFELPENEPQKSDPS